MVGTLFDCKLEVRFEHGEHYDIINMYVKMYGAKIITTDCDDQFKKDDQVDHESPRLEFMVYMTSLWCPFADYIRFIEAIVIQVEECSFSWDPEGPYGAMKWSRSSLNKDGFLTIEWSAWKDKFEHRMHLETRQVVDILYNAFRRFVESTEYEPIRYEELTMGELLVEGLGFQYSEEAIRTHFQSLDLSLVRKLISAIMERVARRKGGNSKTELWPEDAMQLRLPIDFDECLSLYGDFHYVETDRDIPSEWADWDLPQREEDLIKYFKCYSPGFSDGAKLRELRSTIIEDYLAN